MRDFLRMSCRPLLSLVALTTLPLGGPRPAAPAPSPAPPPPAAAPPAAPGASPARWVDDPVDTTALSTPLAPVLLTAALVQHYFAVQDALLDWLDARAKAIQAGDSSQGKLPIMTITFTAPRANGTDTVRRYRQVLDVAALAAQEPAVAALFRAQQLAPAQYLPVRQSIRNAQHAAWDVKAGVPLAQPEGIPGQNVRYVLAHCRDFEGQQEVVYLGLSINDWQCAWLAPLGAPSAARGGTPATPVPSAGAAGHGAGQDTLPLPPLLQLTAANIERYVAVQTAISAFSQTFLDGHIYVGPGTDVARVAPMDSARVVVVDAEGRDVTKWTYTVDGTRLAALDPVYAAVFAAHQLPPAQFLPLTLTLRATVRDMRQMLKQDSVNDLDPASVAGKNFAVVREHCQLFEKNARFLSYLLNTGSVCADSKAIKARTK